MRPTSNTPLGVCLVGIGVLAIASLIGTPARADEQKLAYGKHLSQECTTCHRPDGKGTNIPVIYGLEVDYFRTTMKFYKTGARENAVMNSVAQMLNDEQLDALAIYLATQKPPGKPAPPSRKK
jgi:cytochrome c553